MPHSFVRFLRFYASIVVLLISSVLAIGIEPVRDGVGAGKINIPPGMVRHVHVAPGVGPVTLQSIEKLAGMRDNVPAAIPALDSGSFAWKSSSVSRDDIATRICSQAILRVRGES